MQYLTYWNWFIESHIESEPKPEANENCEDHHSDKLLDNMFHHHKINTQLGILVQIGQQVYPSQKYHTRTQLPVRWGRTKTFIRYSNYCKYWRQNKEWELQYKFPVLKVELKATTIDLPAASIEENSFQYQLNQGQDGYDHHRKKKKIVATIRNTCIEKNNGS